MKVVNWKGIIESLLFAAGDEGLNLKQISQVLELELSLTEELVKEMKEEYETDENRGVTIVHFGENFQLVTKKEHSVYLKRLVESPTTSTLSQAALETLAIISYKQPITRAEIEEIRGVKSERPLHTLIGKVLVKEVGRAEGTGRAILYGTTKEFLDYFGLRSLDELPPLPEKVDEDFIQEEADLFFEKFQETMES